MWPQGKPREVLPGYLHHVGSEVYEGAHLHGRCVLHREGLVSLHKPLRRAAATHAEAGKGSPQ